MHHGIPPQVTNNGQWMHSILESIGGNIVIPQSNVSSTSGSGVVIQNPMTMNMVEDTRRVDDAAALAANQHKIQDVWQHNLWTAIKEVREVSQKYKYIAMDTEFPGVVSRPIGVFSSTSDYLYRLLKCNVDVLRLIQLGLTFFDEHGNLPEGPYTTWQFNFKFSLSEDMYAQDSIDLLTNSRIQFKKHEEEGINSFQFAALLTSSGLVLSDDTYWLTFHSSFDFGYMMRLLMNEVLPEVEKEFFELFSLYFPKAYDVKYLMKSCKNLKGGLQEVADQLELQRIGPQHQAGSDSLLTGMAFFKIRDMYFEGMIDDAKYNGHLFGLGPVIVGKGKNSSEQEPL